MLLKLTQQRHSPFWYDAKQYINNDLAEGDGAYCQPEETLLTEVSAYFHPEETLLTEVSAYCHPEETLLTEPSAYYHPEETLLTEWVHIVTPRKHCWPRRVHIVTLRKHCWPRRVHIVNPRKHCWPRWVHIVNPRKHCWTPCPCCNAYSAVFYPYIKMNFPCLKHHDPNKCTTSTGTLLFDLQTGEISCNNMYCFYLQVSITTPQSYD